MRQLILAFLFLSISQGNAQTIKIVNIKNTPVENVGIYSNDIKIGESDKNGNVILNKTQLKDSIYLIKNGFYNAGVSILNLPKEFQLDSLKTFIIEGVIIQNLDAKKSLTKVVEAGKSGELYSAFGNVGVYDELKSNNKVFYKVVNNFFYKPKIGRFIENKNNVKKDFKVIEEKVNGFSVLKKVIDLKNQKFALINFTVSNYGYVSGRFIPQLNRISQNLDDYNFKIKKQDEKIIIEFSPNKTSKNDMYIGRIIFDNEDYGIYEGIFNLVPNKKTLKTYINGDPKTKAEFDIVQEKFVIQNEKINNKYKVLFSKYNMIFKGMNGNIKNELFYNDYEIKTIDFLNVETAISFNFNTYEFTN